MGDLRDWSPEPNGAVFGERPSSSSSSVPSNQTAIGAEYWQRAEEATQAIIAQVQPTVVSEERRKAVIDYVQRLIRNYLGCEVFPFGSVPLKTYLPDGDIDLTAFGGLNVEEALANDVCSVLEREDQNKAAEFVVKDAQLIRAEVKLVKCLVQNIVVDISFNQLGGLSTLCFLEQVDRLIGKDHLFKRSIILIKAWCYYESRILGAHHGLISTYALETLVLYIFHLFHSSLNGPLAVLYKFLDYFSKFDWDSYCISLNGPVRISSLPEVVVETPENSGGDLLLSSEFLKECVEQFSVPSRGFDTNSRSFPPKHLNIVDPLKENNNLGRSVSKGNFYRIRSAFTYGARKLGHILSQPEESLTDELRKFFSNTLDRHGSGQRPDVQDPVPLSRYNGFGVSSTFLGTELCREDQTIYESEPNSSGITENCRIDDEAELCGGVGKIKVSGMESSYFRTINEPHNSGNGTAVSETRLSGDAKDLATSKNLNLVISNETSKCSSLSGEESKARHAPHLYFSSSTMGNGEIRNGNSEWKQQLNSSSAEKNVTSGILPTHYKETGLILLNGQDENQLDVNHGASSPVGSNHHPSLMSTIPWSTEEFNFSYSGYHTSPRTVGSPRAANSLSDLSGDYESHLISLNHVRWWYEHALNSSYSPMSPQLLSQFQSKNSWDLMQRSLPFSRRVASCIFWVLLMDAEEKAAVKGGEISMSEKKNVNGSEVVIKISSDESPKDNVNARNSKGSSSEATTEPVTAGFAATSVPASSPSPEIRFASSPNKPPKIPTTNEAATLARRRSLARSVYSKPKSRFGEPSYIDDNAFDEHVDLSRRDQVGVNSPYRTSFSRASPNSKSGLSARTNSITPKTSLMASPRGPGEDDEEIYKKVKLIKEKRNKVKPIVLIEWIFFASTVGCLVASLTWDELEKSVIWGLEVWKWCLLVLVIFSGMLVTNWVMHFIVFLIEKNFLLRKKVLYFVHGLKKIVKVFIWLALVLITWVFLFDHGVKRSKLATKILDYISWTLVTIQIGAFLWLLKTLLLKILASNFHVTRFFDRIQESVFHQYVLQTLSGPALIEEAERVGRSPSFGQLSIKNKKKGKESEKTKIIDMGKVHKMKQEKVSMWTMKVLVDAVMNSGLSTISNALDESIEDGGEQADKEITSEMEARAAAFYIFRNVAQHDSKYIEEEDLLRFMIKEEVDLVFPLIEGWDKGQIDRKALTDWVVKVYNDRKALAHALTDTKTAVKQLDKLVTAIVVVVTIIVWLLLMGIATTKVIVFLSSQFVAAAFVFGTTCRTIFEAIIFVFVMHPFDVGDRCVVDGVPLLVEEMNILTTIFLKLSNEKISYPNSVLATKPISNYNRSPDMSDTVEFSIAFATPIEKIGMLKERIKLYLENNSLHWYPNHSVVVKEIENVNKIKIALYCNHTMNFQEFGEKNNRRSALITELKKFFEELEINYSLLPQQVHLHHIGTESATLTGK